MGGHPTKLLGPSLRGRDCPERLVSHKELSRHDLILPLATKHRELGDLCINHKESDVEVPRRLGFDGVKLTAASAKSPKSQRGLGLRRLVIRHLRLGLLGRLGLIQLPVRQSLPHQGRHSLGQG